MSKQRSRTPTPTDSETVVPPGAVAGWRGRPTWAEIDLDAIADNVRALRSALRPGVGLLAVVKANAYGHGAAPVARAALGAGAAGLGVACVDEAIELRQAGVGAPIVVLGYVPHWEAELCVYHGLTVAVASRKLAFALAAVSGAAGVRTKVHIKVDTGMCRFGVPAPEAADFAAAVAAVPGLQLEGIFTHLATAEDPEGEHLTRQRAAFESVLAAVRARRIAIPLAHAANTAASLYRPDMHYQMVRCGLGIYGYHPSDRQSPVALRPALTLRSRLARVQDLEPGCVVGYGATYRTERRTRLGLVPLGYADGWGRALGGRGALLVRGRRCPIVGRVSMDQLTISIPDGLRPAQDEEVVALGSQGSETIDAGEVASWRGTIDYEVLTGISARVPRLYRSDGRLVAYRTLADAAVTPD